MTSLPRPSLIHRRVVTLVFAAIISVTALPALHAWTGDLNAVLGAKHMDDDPWEPIDSQPSFGLMSDVRQEDWPLNLALDLYYSGDEGTASGVSREGSTTEVNFGIRKIWRTTRAMRPFVGVGSSFVRASLTDKTAGLPERSDTDWGAGVWIGGGVYWTLADALNVGFTLKHTSAKVTLLDERSDAGGQFFGTVIGLSF